MRLGEVLQTDWGECFQSRGRLKLDIDVIWELSGRKGNLVFNLSRLHSSGTVAMRKHYRLGGLGNGDWFFSLVGSWSPQIKVLTGLVNLEALALACRQEPCCVLSWIFHHECSFLVFSLPHTGSPVLLNWLWSPPPLYISHLFKDLLSKYSYSLKYWWLKLQERNVVRRV